MLFYILSYFGTLYYYFPSNQQFGLTWFTVFSQKILTAYSQMLSGKLNYLPDFLALSIILFLLILLTVLLIRYERWVLSYVLLISYLLMLVVFNSLDLKLQVVLLTSFAILFYGLKQYSSIRIKTRWSLFFIRSVLLLFIVGASYLVPVVFPQAQRFLFTHTTGIRNYLNQQGLYQHIADYGTNTSSKSGFSDNDSQLGGPLMDDDTILFTAKQTSAHYWRVETKNYFTGKGWGNHSETTLAPTQQPVIITTNPEYTGALEPETTVSLTFTSPQSYLPYPYGTSSIPFEEIGQTNQIEEKERINLLADPKTIQFTWQKANFSQDMLQQIPYQHSQDTAMTQVPSSIPKRVAELARSLTENQVTLLDKVKAVERYLKQDGGYRYSKLDTPFTPQGEDYVDYFLFESKVGYCDNFSSAMTVLLRSVGISSRWAKGFSAGERITTNDALYQEYAIKNSDAHSWPEVYFEGYGWIPFEPTPSFTNAESQTETPETTTTEQTTSNTTETTTPVETQETTTLSGSVENTSQEEEQRPSSAKWWSTLQKLVLGILIILIVFCGFFLRNYLFLLRLRLYLALHPKDFAGAYTLVLRKAEILLKRQPTEPLTIYASRFEQLYPETQHWFIQLTALYERQLYSDQKLNYAEYREILLHTAHLLTNLKKESV